MAVSISIERDQMNHIKKTFSGTDFGEYKIKNKTENMVAKSIENRKTAHSNLVKSQDLSKEKGLPTNEIWSRK